MRYYEPGQNVPANGVYRVYHNSHRLMHKVTLLKVDLFPCCQHCDKKVRFQLVRKITNWRCLPPFRSGEILTVFREQPPLLQVDC